LCTKEEDGFRVAMIVYNGALIGLIEFEKNKLPVVNIGLSLERKRVPVSPNLDNKQAAFTPG